jgi:hypothetical protein
MSLENHPDVLIQATYQVVVNAIRNPTMLTYTSAALMGLLLSIASVSESKTANQTVQLQPATQNLEIAALPTSRRIAHRGSGRIGYGMMS